MTCLSISDIIIIIIIIYLIVLFYEPLDKKIEGFSLSNKPMEIEDASLNHSPIDNLDYQTPSFIVTPSKRKPVVMDYSNTPHS